jgi:hypothetical protein
MAPSLFAPGAMLDSQINSLDWALEQETTEAHETASASSNGASLSTNFEHD